MADKNKDYPGSKYKKRHLKDLSVEEIEEIVHKCEEKHWT